MEGATFGLACAIIASYCFYLLSAKGVIGDFYLGKVSCLVLGLILGLLGPLGDLLEFF